MRILCNPSSSEIICVERSCVRSSRSFQHPLLSFSIDLFVFAWKRRRRKKGNNLMLLSFDMTTFWWLEQTDIGSLICLLVHATGGSEIVADCNAGLRLTVVGFLVPEDLVACRARCTGNLYHVMSLNRNEWSLRQVVRLSGCIKCGKEAT